MKRVALFATIAASFALISVSSSGSSTSAERYTAKKQYYHANGYIKAIGHVARRTIYHPDPRIKHKWRAALAYLIRVRHRAYITLHPRPAVLWPPHHLLWACIHGHEGDWGNQDTGGNGHWGGLQMHPDWGYGTYHHASDNTQLEQEWAAERGYAASGYSRDWLYGQWAHADCLKFA